METVEELPILTKSEEIVVVPGWNVDLEDAVEIQIQLDKSKLLRGSISDGTPDGFTFDWDSSATITTNRTPDDKEYQITIQESKDGGETWEKPFKTSVGLLTQAPYFTSAIVIESGDGEHSHDSTISFKYMDQNCKYRIRALQRERSLRGSKTDLRESNGDLKSSSADLKATLTTSTELNRSNGDSTEDLKLEVKSSTEGLKETNDATHSSEQEMEVVEIDDKVEAKTDDTVVEEKAVIDAEKELGNCYYKCNIL